MVNNDAIQFLSSFFNPSMSSNQSLAEYCHCIAGFIPALAAPLSLIVAAARAGVNKLWLVSYISRIYFDSPPVLRWKHIEIIMIIMNSRTLHWISPLVSLLLLLRPWPESKLFLIYLSKACDSKQYKEWFHKFFHNVFFLCYKSKIIIYM